MDNYVLKRGDCYYSAGDFVAPSRITAERFSMRQASAIKKLREEWDREEDISDEINIEEVCDL